MALSLRVIAVDHNRILREGICVLIEMQPDLELVGSAASAEEAVRLFAERRPGLTLMDLDLPADGALDAIRRIRQMDPTAWIIALITDEWHERGSQAAAAGVTAILAKDAIGKTLVPLIRAAATLKQG